MIYELIIASVASAAIAVPVSIVVSRYVVFLHNRAKDIHQDVQDKPVQKIDDAVKEELVERTKQHIDKFKSLTDQLNSLASIYEITYQTLLAYMNSVGTNLPFEENTRELIELSIQSRKLYLDAIKKGKLSITIPLPGNEH